MSTHIYQSAFSRECADSSTSNAASLPTPRTSSSVPQEPSRPSGGSLASFICRVAYLENELRARSTAFFNSDHGIKATSRVELGSGASFSVERGTFTGGPDVIRNSLDANAQKYIAIKRVREGPGTLTKANLTRHRNQVQHSKQADWTDILLEIRALLHEPLRYHPNIVRLLSLGWGSSSETGSIYPTLILEYAAFGSLHHLQANSLPLPFRVKQKLCYDVARGLSILHACGIVHGDLKHENVLVFENRYDTLEGQLYTAKLADFGGAVMDIAEGDSHFLRMEHFLTMRQKLVNH